jgi:hypothetical protein
MKVKEWVKLLQEQNQEAEIVPDSAGNFGDDTLMVVFGIADNHDGTLSFCVEVEDNPESLDLLFAPEDDEEEEK